MEPQFLQIGMLCASTTALGPGRRFVIWLQGCKRRCYGCASPEFQPLDGGTRISVDQLLDKIVESTDIDGLTVSGGEPMLQKEALSSLLHKVREMRPDLSVILFTGYLLEDFQSDVSKDVLDCIDLLIDGEYYHEQNDDMGLRGSAHQRLHFLTSRLTSHKEELETGKRKYDMHLHGDNEIWTIGIAPSRGGFNG